MLQIILQMLMLEGKTTPSNPRVDATVYMDDKEEPYSPTDFFNQSTCKNKVESKCLNLLYYSSYVPKSGWIHINFRQK